MSSPNILLFCVSLCQKQVHCPALLCPVPCLWQLTMPRWLCRGAVVPMLPLSCPEMSCTMEKALADAKALVERLREHDSAAEALIEQTTALSKRVEAMKQVCSWEWKHFQLWGLLCSTE